MKREVTKTISAELKPYGNTDVSALKDVINRDEIRNDYRREIVRLIDERHKALLSKAQDAPLDFTTLEALIRQFNKDKKNSAVKKEVEAEQKSLCRQFIDFLSSKNKEEFKKLTAATPSIVIKEMIADNPGDEHIRTFDRFATYLKDYNLARNNIYAANNKANSAGHRLVTENFSIFIKNKDAYMKLLEEYRIIIDAVYGNLPDLSDFIRSFALTEDYMKFSVQDNIVKYNAVAGEINKVINLYVQQNQDDKNLRKTLKKLRMKNLYKQILFDAESIFPLFTKITSESELKILISTLWEDTLESGKMLDEVIRLLNDIDNYDATGIYIKKKSIDTLSQKLYGNYAIIGRKIGREKIKKADFFSLADAVGSETKLDKFFRPLNGYKSEALVTYAAIKSFDEIMSSDTAVEYVNKFMTALNEFWRIASVIAVPDDSVATDVEFYNVYKEISEKISLINSAYNIVGTFVKHRPIDISKKFRLSFDYPTFMDGWDVDKIMNNEYGAAMFRKENRLYIGVTNKQSIPDFKDIRPAKDGEEIFQFVVYKQLSNPSNQLPRLFKSSAPDDVAKIFANKKSDTPFSDADMVKIVEYYKKCLLERYGDTYDYNFSETSKYKNINDFFKEVAESMYKISFIDIPASQIDEWIDDKKIFMFSVHTKDYQPGAHGTKELFTMFLEALFSEDNLKNDIIRLNGQSSIFMRSKVIKNPYTHKAGSVLLNKRDKSGNPIPNNVHMSLFNYLNGNKSKSDLSDEELSYLDKINYKTSPYDIVKDRRYTSDKFIVNIPITINKGCKVTDKEFNDYVRKEYKLSTDAHIIGIDRGERNMIYITVVDHNGKTVEQKSLNVLDGYDYQMKLTQLEKERRDNQKKWKPAGQIKHFKDGYVGKAVHEICQLMLKYNAIIVMESLNKKFMTRRSAAFGPAIYSKFQKALLNKLSYLVLKDRKPLEKGGILNGYQFASCPDKIDEQPVQYGRVFFVTAGYTSSIDPVTGFVSLFNFDEYGDSNEKAKKFTNGFDIIRVNEENVAELFFSYDKFKTSEKWTNKTWHCIIRGKRIIPHKNQNTGLWEYHNEDMRKELDELFEKYGKKLAAGTDIKELMDDIRKENPEIDKEFVFLMKKVFRLRNFNRETGEDYIISSAVDGYGETFDSRDLRNAEIGRPVNGDSNGSRNIAIKGLMSLRTITETEKFHSVSNADWFRGVGSFSE